MPSDSIPETPDFTVNQDLKLNVTFKFDEQWHVGRVSEANDPTGPDVRVKFPAGGGGAGVRSNSGIVIAPVHLQGLSPDEVAKIIRHRAEDMAMLTEAITIANIQFREALDSIASDDPSASSDDPS